MEIKTEAFYDLQTARLLVLEAWPLIQGPVLVLPVLVLPGHEKKECHEY